MHNFRINKFFSISLIALLVVLILAAGCSSASTTTTSTTALTTTTPAPVTTTSQTTTQAPTTTTSSVSVTTTQAQSIELNISAAASLSNVLKEIDTAYTQLNPNIKITANFASSGTLQQQIEQGAPADVFISAAATQMDNLQKENLILPDTRIDLLKNTLVLIVPSDSTLGITSYNDLTSDKVIHIAIGDPKSVPCGTYALQLFDELGITAQLQPKEVLGSSVTQVLTYVESGNVEAGIVYATDALSSTKVKVVASAPADINAKIIYPAAVIAASKNPDAAKAYLNFLSSDQAKAIFEKYGFTMVGS